MTKYVIMEDHEGYEMYPENYEGSCTVGYPIAVFDTLDEAKRYIEKYNTRMKELEKTYKDPLYRPLHIIEVNQKDELEWNESEEEIEYGSRVYDRVVRIKV